MQGVATLSWSINWSGFENGIRTRSGTTGGWSLGSAAGFAPGRRKARDAGSQPPARQAKPAAAAQASVAPGRRVQDPVSASVHASVEIDGALLVRRCLDGDPGAWAAMVRTHHKRVYTLCYRFTGNPTDAEDLTQDVFLKIYSNLASFDALRGSLPVWITTMTRNLLVDNFRRTRNQRATSSLDEGWDGTDDLSTHARHIDRLMAAGPSPHDHAVRRELEKMVQQALALVSVELREAVILRDLQDLDYKEIAQVLNIPEGTVKSRISRGRAELARLLERNQREVM
jgi:RNA polymerase sigma-70 factor, ECF subfamily